MLAPNTLFPDGTGLRMPMRLTGGRTTVAEFRPGPRGYARVSASGNVRGAAVLAELTVRARRVLCLDNDYSAFYARAANDPDLQWVTRGAGRFVRSATAFEGRREDDLHHELRVVGDHPHDRCTRRAPRRTGERRCERPSLSDAASAGQSAGILVSRRDARGLSRTVRSRDRDDGRARQTRS